MSMLQISQEAISKYSCSVMVWHSHDYIINHTNYLNPKGLTFYGSIFKGFACFRWVWSQMKPGVKIWLQCKRPWNVAWWEVKSREPRRMNGLSCSGEYVIYICWQFWWVLQILNLLSCSIWPWTACTSKPIYDMSALHESCISLYKLFFFAAYIWILVKLLFPFFFECCKETSWCNSKDAEVVLRWWGEYQTWLPARPPQEYAVSVSCKAKKESLD